MKALTNGKKYTMCTISVVIPIYNERENIEPLMNEVREALTASSLPWELLFVDDGSTDGSSELLEELVFDNPFLRVVSFKKNAGQTAALDAGFRHARGSLIVTCDGDGQNNPYDIPRLLRLQQEGYDLVVGKRKKRKDSLAKKLISKSANFVRRKVLDDNVSDTGCSLKVYRKEALDKITLYKGMHRFLPALFQIAGYRVIEIEVDSRPRYKGRSKYTLFNRGFSLVLDMLAVLWMKRRRLHYDIDKVIP
jgi:dolichol-phosphate mannosyltransferase